MRATSFFLAAILLLPAAVQAQEPLYKEVSYVLRTHTVEPLEDLERCAPVAGYLSGGMVARGETSNLFAVTVNDNSGVVDNDQAEKVGEMRACWGMDENELEGPYPTVDTEVVYEFNVGDAEYFALGTSRLRTPGSFLQDGMYLIGVDATVLRVVDGVPIVVVGTLTSNRLVNPNAVGGYRPGDLITLRFFTAYNERDYSALIDALRRAGLI